MANVIGGELNISGLEEGITRLEKKLGELSATTEKNAKAIIDSFSRVNSQGVSQLVTKLGELRNAMSQLSSNQNSGIGNIGTQAISSFESVNKLIEALIKLKQENVLKLQVQQEKLDYDRELNKILKLNLANKERTRTLRQQDADASLAAKRQANDTKELMNREEERGRQLMLQNKRNIAAYKKEAAELKRVTAEIDRQAKAYKAMPSKLKQSDVNKLFTQSTKATTINQHITAIHNLKNALLDLDTTSKKYNENQKRINSEIQRHQQALAKLGVEFGKLKNATKETFKPLDQLQRQLALLFSFSAIKGYVNKLISVRGEFELQQKALSAILQSKNQADKLWNQTVKLAIRSPYTVKELVGYTKQLAAYRIETDKLHDTTKRLADVSAGLGVDMQRIILAYGQVRAAAYLRGTELRQFTEAGIPLLEELAAHFSKLEGRAISVGDVFGMISKRLVSFEDVAAVFKKMTDEGGVFYQMQEKQAESLKGMMSNLKDRIDLMLNDIGSANDSVLKDMVSLAQSFIANWREVWEQLSDAAIAFGVYKLAAFGATMATKQFGAAILFTTPKLQSWAKQMKMTIVLNQELATSAKFGQRAMIMLGNTARYVGIAFAGLARAFVAFLPFAIIAGVYELIMQLTSASRAAEELHNALARIDAGLEKELEESIGTYKVLATTIRDVTNSYAEREKALETLKRTFGEILPSQMLELEYVLDLKDGYDEATTALKKYYETKSREQKFAKIDESFEEELSKDINDIYAQFDDMKYKGKGGLKYNIMEEYGLDERHVKQVLRKVVEEVKKGNVEIANFQDEFIKRLNKMYNIDIDLSKFTYDTYDFYHQIGDIVETLTRYREEIDAVVGMDYDTIADERHAKELEEANKKYEALTATLQKLSSAYSTYYNTVQALKNKEVVTDEDRERLKNYRQDIYDLYNELGVRGHLPNGNKFTQITASVYDIENEIERLSTIINNRFVGSLKNATTTGNTELLKLKNTINDITKSFDGTNLQQVTERLYRAIAEQYEMPLSAFDKLKVDGKTSVTDLRKTIENEIKSIEESIKAFDTALKNQPKIYNADYALAEVEKAQGFTKKQIEDMRVFVKMFTLALNALGGATRNTNKKGNSIWEQRISLLKELRREYENLSKTFNKTTSRQKVMNGYMEAANELFKDLGIDISQIPFDDLERMSAFVSELMKEVKEGSKDEIKLGKLKGFFDVDIETKDTKDYQEKLIKQMQNLFDNYELGKELEKLHLPKDLMKQLFDVDVLNLDELRDRITSMDISNFGEDALKEYDKLLDKIREMELKEQEERMKMYSKYLIKAQNERVKAKIDEMKQIEEINKTFVMADDAIINMGIDATQLENIRESLATQNLTLEQAIENWVIYRDTLQTLGVTDVQIQKLYEYLLALREASKLATSGVQKETQEKLDKEAWESFKASTLYEQLFSDLENLGNKSIEMLITKLGDLKDNLKNLPPNIYKEIQGQISRLEEIQMKRDPFGAYYESWKKIRDLKKEGVTLEDIDASGNTTERKVGGTEDELTEALVSEQAKIESLKEQQVLYSQLKQAQGDENKLKAAGITLTEGQKKLLKMTQGEYDQLILGAKEQEEQARENAESLGISLETYKKMRAANEKAIAHAKAWGEALTGVLDGIDAILDAFGLAEDSTARLWIKNAKQIADMVVQVVILTISLQAMGVAANMALGVIGWIATALQAVALLFSSIFAAHDNALEKQIQELQDNVEKLEKTFDKLKKAIDRDFSSASLDFHMDEALSNLQKQINSYYDMIELERDKKDSDSDKIDEYRDRIDELNEEYQELKEEMVESLGGSYDIRGTTREFVDAWLEAFKETGDGLQGLKDNFKEFFQNILLEQAVMTGAGEIMRPLLEEINESLADNYKIDSSEYDVIKQKGEITMKQLNDFLNGLLGEGGLFNEFMTDAGDSLSGLQKGIQGITEAQADIIAAYLNSLRFYVADSNTKLTQLVDMQTNDSIPNPMLAELKAQTELIRGIRDMFSSVIRSGHPTYGGAFLKVAL